MCRTYHRLGKSSWTHLMELLGEWTIWNLDLVHLKTMLVLVKYRCMVWAKRTIGSENIFDPLNGTPWS
jgi:hypothetical protein